MRAIFRSIIFLIFSALAAVAHGEEGVVFAGISESTGAGVIAGTSFKNGYNLAIEEINRDGGIAGKPIVVKQFNIETNAEAAKAGVTAAVAQKPFAILGPVFSGLTLATLPLTGAAGIPQFVGAEAASISQKFAKNMFRTSLTQEIAMPRVASFVKHAFQPKKVLIIYVDNEFGKDGKDIFLKSMKRTATISTDALPVPPGHKDFVAVVGQVKSQNPDVLVLYTNEAEAVGLLKELRQQQFNKPVVGEGPVVAQQVIDLAGGAAEGIYAHTGVSVDAPGERIQNFTKRFKARYQLAPDHNSLKGYFAVYAIKSMLDVSGVVDQQTFIANMKKARLDPAKQPNVLVRGYYDLFGSLYRESYIVQIKNGRQAVLGTVPLGEGPNIDLVSGQEVMLDSRDGRKQFFAQTSDVARK